jgi:hypothetical protein
VLVDCGARKDRAGKDNVVKYRHFWVYDPTEHCWAATWPTIVADTARVLDRTTELGITIYGPDGHGAPILDTDGGIAFNGAAGEQADPLRLTAPHHTPHPSPYGMPAPLTCSVQTGRHPYDVVAAVLLHCHVLLGEDFPLFSHGLW